jgi:DNA replication protein DnaC
METTQEHAVNALEWLASRVKAAPEGDDSQETTQSDYRPSLVREANGWGKRYCARIDLTGDKWFSAYQSAIPIIASGGIVAMVGQRGPGKTQMAAEIARNGEWTDDEPTYIPGYGGAGITKHTKTALYRRAMDIFLDLRDAAKNHVQSSEKQVLAKLAAVGLLVIDEFQERGESDWENKVMKNLIDKRYAACRPTIIIANLTRRELFESLGSSIVDRARENGKSIEFDWPSYRGDTPSKLGK